MKALIYPTGDGKYDMALGAITEADTARRLEGPFDTPAQARRAFARARELFQSARVEEIDHDPHGCDCHEVV